MNRTAVLAVAACGVLLILPASGPALAQAQQQGPMTPPQRVAAIKQQLQASQARLRAYEWIETTTVSKDGEQSSRTQKRCYYGADGKLQKVVLEKTASEPRGGPLMRALAEEKKKEMAAYMQSAEELMHSYVPPVPGLIQRAVDTGKFALQMTDPGRRVRLSFSDYLKPGDALGIDLDVATNRPLGVGVNTYLDTKNDAVQLGVTMAALPDGTIYVQRSQLEAKAKGVVVVVENAGYRRMGQ